MSEIYIGIDPGFTETAIVGLREDGEVIARTVKSRPYQNIYDRIIGLKTMVAYEIGEVINGIGRKCPDAGEVYLGIEEPMGAHKGNGAKIGMAFTACCFAANIILHQDDHVYIRKPTQIKKFITGRGNAKKDVIIREVYKRWGFETDDHNIADAYGLAQMIKQEVQDDGEKKS